MPYIFGYGSLINADSRAKTGQTGEAIPVVVNGLERGWYLPVVERNHCALAVIRNGKSSCNGVLIPVTEEELLKFDIRECEYERLAIPPQNINFYHKTPHQIEQQLIIAYAVTEVKAASQECPIIQSYLDIILTGALDFGETYATDLLQTTQAWNHYYINDRSAPRYVRAEPNPRAAYCDELIKKCQPEALKLRKG